MNFVSPSLSKNKTVVDIVAVAAIIETISREFAIT